MNQMADLSEKIGADIGHLALALGMDERISPEFLHSGPGYGGKSFSRQIKTMLHTGEQYDADLSLMREVIEANERQKKRVVNRLEEAVGSFENRIVTILGLSYKPMTRKVIESPAIAIVNEFIFKGAEVQVHDPEAMDNFKKQFPYIHYCHTLEDACRGADILVIVTEWDEYKTLEPQRLKELMNGKIIYDSRNILSPEKFILEGFEFFGTGRKYRGHSLSGDITNPLEV